MIHLKLTIQEAIALRTQLANCELDGLGEDIQHILHKLDLAQHQATHTQLCPVCQTPFTQLTTGRTGQYCTAACKQKAYRQRRNAWRRQIPSGF